MEHGKSGTFILKPYTNKIYAEHATNFLWVAKE